MYAVIKTGGKQHRVVVDELLKVELLKAETGATIKFEDVLMIVDGETVKIGQPIVEGASVEVEVVEHGRGEKSVSLSTTVVSIITKSKVTANGIPC